MNVPTLHRWDLTPGEAVALQRELAARVDVSTPLGRCDLIAGADASYNRFSNTIYAGVVVWQASDATVVERRAAVLETDFPYVPGLLSFREAPALIEAFRQLETVPDVILFDGQGVAHPRRLGIASHVGLWLNLPSVGCAKSRLFGRFVEPSLEAGSASPLTAGKEVVGDVLRTRTGVSPLYVSPGHRVDRAGAVRAVQMGLRKVRQPEPTRLAHDYVNEVRRRGLGK
jgi:deoxyribonuclease V